MNETENIENNDKQNRFVILKGHKENFNNNPTVRIINYARNELEHIIKLVLDLLNKNKLETMNLNQCSTHY